MKGMDMQAKVGQLLVATLPARADNVTRKQVKVLVKKYKLGGLLFAEGTAEEQAVISNLAQKGSKIPMMMTFDGEWALPMRLQQTPDFPRNAALGCVEDDALIEEYGREVGREMRSLGIHVNFAPAADVNTNPLNPVIHVRSFGENPERVAAKVLAYCRGLESEGVLAVGKHFPGHGDSQTDSHWALPELKHDRHRLDSVELYPFRRMIEAGHGAVMVGHLKVPALDSKGTPSSLSEPIVGGLLRGEMGFDGLVFTDALDMKGVAGESQIYVKALQAGNDVLLVQYDAPRAFDELMQAVAEGSLSRETVEQHCRRVLAYKYLLGLRGKQGALPTKGVTKRLSSDDASQLASRLRKASVTVLRNYFDVLPLATDKGKVAVLSVGEQGSDSAFVTSLGQLCEVAHYVLPADSAQLQSGELSKTLSAYRRVVVSVTDKRYINAHQAAFLSALNLPSPLVYALFSSYRMMRPMQSALEKSAAVVLAHSCEPDLQEHVARLLLGHEGADGRFSMSLNPAFPEGSGCTLASGAKATAYVPEDYGMKSYRLHQIEELARQGLQAGAYPGCRVLVLKDGVAMLDKGYGVHSPVDATPVRSTDLFDVAAITRTAATVLAVMKLYDTGKLQLDAKLSTYLPSLRSTNKANLTVRQLLMHEGGLPAYDRFYLDAIDPNSVHGPYMQSWVDTWHHTRVSEHSYWCSDFRFKKGIASLMPTAQHTLQVSDSLWLNRSFHQQVMQKVNNCAVSGRIYVDSDLGFLLLQQVVEKLAGMPLDAYVEREFYTPMGLERTLFLPLRKYPKGEVMPTVFNDFLRRTHLCGFVHDEAAACLGGVAGHAGLFTTASELGRIYQMLIDGGVYQGKRLLGEATCRLFLSEKSAISRRGLGFDRPDPEHPKQSICLAEAPLTTFGHSGFTGTAVWADPQSRWIFVFLSNRLCPEVWNSRLGDMYLIKQMQQALLDSMK